MAGGDCHKTVIKRIQHSEMASKPEPGTGREQNQTSPRASALTRAVVLIVDGMGDLPVPELNGKTPLEAAFTPNLDRLAGTGWYGQIDPIAPGITPNTDSGTGMLMGMSPDHADRLRRGPVEAAGAGYPLQQGDVAMRANFASVQSSGEQCMVTDRRAGRIEHDVPALIAALSAIETPPGFSVQLRATDQHRAVLVMSAAGLDGQISDTDPGDEKLPAPMLRSLASRPEAEFTAEMLNRYLDAVKALLQGHAVNQQRAALGKPLANALITRGAGEAVEIGNVIRDHVWICGNQGPPLHCHPRYRY
jgi:2,3-bisphosphoglycerate-independent phosphoglycerate mutase